MNHTSGLTQHTLKMENTVQAMGSTSILNKK